MTGLSVTLTEAQESDRAFFIEVHHLAYRTHIEAMFGWDADLQREYANSAFDSENIFIVWLDGEQVGVVGLDILPDFVWLKQLYILPTYQRKGVGGFVVRWAIGISQSRKKELRLQTLKVNVSAVEFYQRYGFEISEETDTHWELSRAVDGCFHEK